MENVFIFTMIDSIYDGGKANEVTHLTYLEPDVGVKNTIFAFPKTFTIFYLSIYYFKAKVRLILTLIMVICTGTPKLRRPRVLSNNKPFPL